MRMTVDLPREVYDRVKRLAEERGQSLSDTLVQLTSWGLATMGEPTTISSDPVTGLPTLNLGHRITAVDVTQALDDE